ncbi:MAG: hypothetical protein IIB14_10270 [Chloroflexi bacterium]|nr:hypothetical protein [Chloroflexota bacterium]
MSRNAKRISIITAALIVLATAIASQVVRPAWPDGRVPVISAAGVGEFLEEYRETSDSYEPKSDLPDGEVQYVTFNSAVVEGLNLAETSVAADGTSLFLASPMSPGKDFSLHIDLNNFSPDDQDFELTVNVPDGVTAEVSVPTGAAMVADMQRMSENLWSFTASGEAEPTSFTFDIVVSFFSSHQLDLDAGRISLRLTPSS